MLDPLREPLIDLIESGGLPRTEPHDCTYLPGRLASSEGFTIPLLHADTYHDLMDMGFRRSGRVVYRPRCQSCSACIPLRITVNEFIPTKSQRRTLRRNEDLTMHIAAPLFTDEKLALYQRYLAHQHPGSPQSADGEGLREFLYESIVDTIEVEYRLRDRLIAVSILDRSSRALSSVYHYFDPDEGQRSPGVYSILREIDYAREQSIPHYYLGYWIKGCSTMDYKANYRPHEILMDGQWSRATD